jgi:hypothetical protein
MEALGEYRGLNKSQLVRQLVNNAYQAAKRAGRVK